MNKNGLMSKKKKIKAKRREKGDTNASEPAEINKFRCASPARRGVNCSIFPNPNGVESLFTLAQSLPSPYTNKQTSVSKHDPREKIKRKCTRLRSRVCAPGSRSPRTTAGRDD